MSVCLRPYEFHMSITNGPLRLASKESYLCLSLPSCSFSLYRKLSRQELHNFEVSITTKNFQHPIFSNASITPTSEVSTPAMLVLFMV
jgi:hypothetical protein